MPDSNNDNKAMYDFHIDQQHWQLDSGDTTNLSGISERRWDEQDFSGFQDVDLENDNTAANHVAVHVNDTYTHQRTREREQARARASARAAAATAAATARVYGVPPPPPAPGKLFKCIFYGFMCIWIVLFAFFIVGVIAGDIEFGWPTSTPSESSESSFTQPAMSAFSAAMQFTEQSLPLYTQDSLQLEHSPQSQALVWLANDAAFDGYALDQKLQRFALGTLYFATKQLQHDKTTATGAITWTDGYMNECDWSPTAWKFESRGGCDRDGSFTDLQFSGLDGTLPAELALLANLNSLRIRSNPNVKGPIPRQYGLLTNLKTLELSFNQLQGTLATELGQLTQLGTLRVGGNDLVGQLPSELGSLVILKTLDLHKNMFSGTIPSELGNLVELETLRLGSLNVTGAVPPEVCALQKNHALTTIEVDCDLVTCSCDCSCV